MKKIQKQESTVKTHTLLEETLPEAPKLLPHITEIGEVIYIGDGICKVKGLPNARIDDMIKIDAKGEEVSALILGLTQDIVEAVVLGDFTRVSKGDIVKSSRRRVTIPIGEGVLGRVINPLGKPVDGKGELSAKKTAPVENPAPPVNEREQITDQVRTGILVVDSIIPVGKGQRELVIGDRKTGKSTLMLNLINNQKGNGIYCIYVSIGGKKAKLKGIIENLEKSGALEYTVVVIATADDPPSLNYIAPYAGCSIAEHFMREGKDAIVIYDDLSKHAKSYRQMSLLLKRSPGRDAYPGDIFFLHSRLLERSARITKEAGGGSSTAFPMAETQSGDISEYITTNLMSITDGHIYLDANLMHAGILPAVDSGASVSRIGGSIQTKLLRKLSELAATQLQRYNEVKSYENINTEITEETEREIKRGKRILEIFTQSSSTRFSLAEEVLLLYIVTQGKIDEMEVLDVRKLKKEIIARLRSGEMDHMKELLSSTSQSLEDVKEELDAFFTPDYLISLISSEQKAEVDASQAKPLNKEGLKGSIDLNSKKGSSTPVETPKNTSTPPTDTPASSKPAAKQETKKKEKKDEKHAEIPEEQKNIVTIAPHVETVKKIAPIQEESLGEVINNIPEDDIPIKEVTI